MKRAAKKCERYRNMMRNEEAKAKAEAEKEKQEEERDTSKRETVNKRSR